MARQGVTIEARPDGTWLHLLAPPLGNDVAFDQATTAIGLSIRSVSHRQWFATRRSTMSPEELRELTSELDRKVEIVDQSHGRVCIVVKGPASVRVLAKGTAVDLSTATFPVGFSATTLIGHIAVHVTRTEHDEFELFVLRGFAESLWQDLDQMSMEFA